MLTFSVGAFAKKVTYAAPIVCGHCVKGIVEAVNQKTKVISQSFDVDKGLVTLELENDYELTEKDLKFINLEAGYMLKKVKEKK